LPLAAHLLPATTGTFNLGSSDLRWQTLFVGSSGIQFSDGTSLTTAPTGGGATGPQGAKGDKGDPGSIANYQEVTVCVDHANGQNKSAMFFGTCSAAGISNGTEMTMLKK
jgi:hypothetical protein